MKTCERTGFVIGVIIFVIVFSPLFKLNPAPKQYEYDASNEYTKISSFCKIQGTDNLFYNSYSKIIYILFANKNLTPYINENGHFCKYMDNNIIEVISDS